MPKKERSNWGWGVSMSKETKYAGMNMYMTDNEDAELIDSNDYFLEKGKNIREHWAHQAERLKKMEAPQNIIDYYTMRSKMTYGENIELDRREEEDRQQWLRDNPPNQEVVEKLYERFDEVKDKLNPVPTSFTIFLKDTLDPLNGILTSEEFDSPQYDLILDLLFSDYLNIHLVV